MFDLPTSISCSHRPAFHTENFRVCDKCNVKQETILSFKQLSDSREFSTTCTTCLLTTKGASMKKPTRQSPLRRAISRQVYRSHERLLEQALEQKPEVTDLSQLRAMNPDYDEAKLLRLQRLNMKINAANDFLIEEQSAWLDPSSRPSGGIAYNEELFGKPFATDEDNAEDINTEVYDEEN